MACSTVRDMFDKIRGLHQEVAAFAGRQDASVLSERVRLVLDYLARHEQNMEKCLADYERTAAHRILDTSFSNLTDLDVERMCNQLVVGPETTSDDIIRLAVEVDGALSRLFQEASEKAPSEDVRVLFSRLHDLNERETRRMVRDMVEVDDI